MKTSDFQFDLPEDLIAQRPAPDRSDSRMLVVERSTGRLADRAFRDFPEYLGPGDRLVLNNTRVLPARLIGKRPGGGAVEALLVKQISASPLRWEALVRPGKKLGVGVVIALEEGLTARVVERGERGLRTLEISPQVDFLQTLDRIGRMPLPPYIKRSAGAEDRERYQTVYAQDPGSAAAPTAGLHFTPEILEQVRSRGALRVDITLHVGLGTFQPVHVDQIEQHRMHSEAFEISPQAASDLDSAQRILAVGTTSVRTLEHAAAEGPIRPGRGETDIFIYPGYRFRAVDALLTNFHLPGSTLLMLLSAFAGHELTMEAYRHAVREQYRFYSYGDCMLVV